MTIIRSKKYIWHQQICNKCAHDFNAWCMCIACGTYHSQGFNKLKYITIEIKIYNKTHKNCFFSLLSKEIIIILLQQ